MSFHTNPRLLAFVPFALFGGLSGLIAWLPAMELNHWNQGSEGDKRPPSVQRGREIYMREGCTTCHTQQVRSDDRLPLDERGERRVLEADARYGVPSRPEDFSWELMPSLGTQRAGPDLFNVGDRVPSADWHYVHLYDPRAVVPSSIMQAYPWMFRTAADHQPGDRLIILTDEIRAHLEPDAAKRRGLKLYATKEAQDLVDYLLWLKPSSRERP